MIHFMPFTFLSESLFGQLHSVLGPVSVCQPLAGLMPDHMIKAASEGRLHICTPENIDQNQLRQSLNDFTTWAALHQGHIGDLIGNFRSRAAGPGAGSDEADARRIQAQLRQRADGVPAGTHTVNPLLEAALFLCLAHTFDQQQETLNRDLGKVQAMEVDLGRILGESEADKGSMGVGLPPFADDGARDPGAYMTRQRLESWARLVASCADVDSAFVTNSSAVLEDLLERWPEARRVAQIAFEAGDPSLCSRESLTEDTAATIISTLARAENTSNAVVDHFKVFAPAKLEASLTLYVIQGRAPHAFLSQFMDKEQADAVHSPAATPPRNTVIGQILV